MRRTKIRLIIATFIFCLVGASLAATASSGFEEVYRETRSVGPGVVYTKVKLEDDAGPQIMNILAVDLENPYIKLEATSGKDRAIGLETVREQAERVIRQGYKPVASFNMDFYNTDPNYAGIPHGIMIREGEIISANSGRVSLGIFSQGHVKIGVPQMKGSISVNRRSIDIDAVNKLRRANDMILYTPCYSPTGTTKTDDTGIEAIISTEGAPLYAKGEIQGVVVEVRDRKGDSQIPQEGMVISGAGIKASWIRRNLKVGTKCTIKMDFDSDWGQAIYLVSGGPVLIHRGRLNLSELMSRTDATNRHPRTAIGIRGKTLYFVTVDGRQPGYSEGVTLTELGRILLDEGLQEAMNVDGGGSSTFALRLPGDSHLSIVNSPSDYRERLVSNAMHVLCIAPEGDLTHITLNPGTIEILAGSDYAFQVSGVDEYYNKISLESVPITWEAEIGSISPQGLFQALREGRGSVRAIVGNAVGEAWVQVVDSIANLEIEPYSLTVSLGQGVSFAVRGLTDEKNQVYIGSNVVEWSVEGDIGTVDAQGRFIGGQGSGEGKVIARVGEHMAQARVLLGKPPIIIEDFEGEELLWTHTAIRARGNVTSASRPRPVWRGTHSGELSYDFTGFSSTSASYMVRSFSTPIILEDRPLAIGLWLYGDGGGHWLRGEYTDGTGALRRLDFTGNGQLDWEGWRYVEALVPEDVELPIRFLKIYVVEPDNTRKNKGCLYIDDITAVFSR